MRIFALAVGVDPTSRWAQPPQGWVITSAPSISTQAPTFDQVAALEALDEAEETLAALPASGDPEDVNDVAQRLRQLRRIVLSPRGLDSDSAAQDSGSQDR